MQVLEVDNVKVYNLSAGKSLPDWLSERKKRALLKKNVDLRRRIELIQEFDMPGVSTSIRVSKDGQYIMATGIYKPRIKCYDVNNLSLKFERCMDSEVVTFEILSEDYTKMVFLQCDRYVEFHVGHGRHYRLRVPRFGRDISYHRPSCDLFVVGASSEVYRLNLELGQFLAPYTTKATEINCCQVNDEHGLLVVGTESGLVEAWDPRTKSRQGILDCALYCTDSDYKNDSLPAITALKFDGPLRMGVGTSTGHVLLYDLRSSKPMLIKEHMNEMPIKSLDFHKNMDYVYSMDSKIVKIWDKNTGKQYSSIESSVDFNDLCVVPGTGLSMMAVEDQKMQIYYIPSLGPAPRWCAFLDNLTEEMESSSTQTVYDDYKFVTKQELESLGLDHLLGTNLLRAYMHGYFVDIRLYKRAKTIADPFAFDEYKKRKIREKIEQERPSRVNIDDNLPKINRELASRLIDNESRKKQLPSNLLKDDRFKALFENPDFEVDKGAAEYHLLNPVLSRLDKKSKNRKKEDEPMEEMEQTEDKDSDMELYESSDESSDEDRSWVKEVKKQHKIIRNKNQDEPEHESAVNDQVYELAKAPKSSNIKSITHISKASLGDRLGKESFSTIVTGTGGNKEMRFSMRGKKTDFDNRKKMKNHYQERKQFVRKTGFLSKKNYFVDIRLYKRAKTIADPFAFDEYKKRKIREKIEQERPSRVNIDDNLPKINRELASRLIDNESRKKQLPSNLLKDDRFKALFENPDFEVDKGAAEYHLLNPVLSRLDKKSKNRKKEDEPMEEMEQTEDKDSDMELYESSDESSDEDRSWVKEVKKQHKIIRNKNQDEPEHESAVNDQVYELAKAPKSSNIKSITHISKASLGDRLGKESFSTIVTGTGGNKEMRFSMRGKKTDFDNRKKMKNHYQERKQFVRKTGFLSKKK